MWEPVSSPGISAKELAGRRSENDSHTAGNRGHPLAHPSLITPAACAQPHQPRQSDENPFPYGDRSAFCGQGPGCAGS